MDDLDLKKRFWAKVEKFRGCWIWMANRYPDGYGQFRINGKPRRAHRISWEHFNGKIPNGLLVCHRCDNPLCVRPSHLFIGTHKENMIDMRKKGRQRQVRGAEHGRAKLTKKDVSAIRVKYRYDGIRQYRLAEEYGVSQSHISKIILKQTWA